ncbi:MAG: hypothetical protein RL489_3442, partial [Pseudomonadota bacterium]
MAMEGDKNGGMEKYTVTLSPEEA